jgi:hypothetical protein
MQPKRIKQAKSAIVVFILYRWEQRLRELLRRIAGLDMNISPTTAERFQVRRFFLVHVDEEEAVERRGNL